jgi:hypothetical protein
MINLIPGHGWGDLAAVAALICAAIALYVFGLIATCGRANRSASVRR